MEEYREAALYIRVSTDKQEELSPDAQKRLGLEYAKKNKIIIRPDHIFVENGISGRHADKRPEFQKMVGLAKQKPSPFQLILVWKFSRFARNQEESIVYKSILHKQCGVDVVSISEPLIEGPFGSLIERIIEWMDEYYSIRLAGEVTRGMTENALRGKYQTTPPLGYKAVGGGKPFVIDEETFKIVSFVYQKALAHVMPTEIARQLNDMGMLTKRRTPFEARNIKYILNNRFYIGKLIWKGIERDGAHETRITQEMYDQAQEWLTIISPPKVRRRIGVCKHWLSGLLKCSVCGSSLAYNARGKGGTQFFNCWKYAKGFHRGSCSVSRGKAEAAVIEYFTNILNGEDFSFSYLPAIDESADLERASYEEELKKLELREVRIRLAYENGVDTLEEYKENKTRLQEERERLQALLAEAEPEPEGPQKEEILEKVRSALDVITDEAVDYEVKGTLMRSIVEEIIFDRATETFTFRLYSH